jgi:hypothetical protein
LARAQRGAGTAQEDAARLQNAEYLVVVQLLNRPNGRERRRMYSALSSLAQPAIDEAIESLHAAGVIVVKGQRIRPSPALACLERLELIAV